MLAAEITQEFDQEMDQELMDEEMQDDYEEENDYEDQNGELNQEEEEYAHFTEKLNARSRQEKAALKRSYRETIQDLRENMDDLVKQDAHLLLEKMECVNALFGQVQSTEDAALDSVAINLIADISLKKTRALKMNASVFDVSVFVSKLNGWLTKENYEQNTQISGNFMQLSHGEDGQGRNWLGLQKLVNRASKRAPSIDFMLGPLSIEVKPKEKKKRAQHEANTSATVKPIELKDQVQENTNETTQNVVLVGQYLQKARRMNFFSFFINPASFSQSVENLFYLSFHIRDGRAKLQVEEGVPMVEFVEEESDDDDNGEGRDSDRRTKEKTQKKQLVMDLDMATWQGLIEKYHIRDTFLPTRKSVISNLDSNKWYG